jgi:hypothetical protein
VNPVRVAFLHLDDALRAQPALMEAGQRRGARIFDARDDARRLRLWCRPADLRALRLRLRTDLPAAGAPELVYTGSGDFHHVSILLIARALEHASGPATVVHFDNHPDWMRCPMGIHCGSWAAHAAKMPRVARVVTVGVCSPDIRRRKLKAADTAAVTQGRVELYAYRGEHGAGAVRLCGRVWPTIEAIGVDAFTDHLLSRIETKHVYITIDKDVFRPREAVTNWDQGHIGLPFMLSMLEALVAHRRVIGADIVGDYSPPAFGGGWLAATRKRGEALLDQPWRRPDTARAAVINQATNLALLDIFTGAQP